MSSVSSHLMKHIWNNFYSIIYILSQIKVTHEV